MSPTGRKPSEPQIQNFPGTIAHSMEMAGSNLTKYLESPEHKAQVGRVKAMSTELHKILEELADKFGCTKQEMAKLIQRRLERREREKHEPR